MPLLSLPPELQLKICDYLSPAEKQLLRMTCRLLNIIFPPATFGDLYRIELSPYNVHDYLLCTKCAELQGLEKWLIDIYVDYKCRRCGKKRDWFLPAGFDGTNPLPFREERGKLRRLREAQGLGRAWWDGKGWVS